VCLVLTSVWQRIFILIWLQGTWTHSDVTSLKKQRVIKKTVKLSEGKLVHIHGMMCWLQRSVSVRDKSSACVRMRLGVSLKAQKIKFEFSYAREFEFPPPSLSSYVYIKLTPWSGVLQKLIATRPVNSPPFVTVFIGARHWSLFCAS